MIGNWLGMSDTIKLLVLVSSTTAPSEVSIAFTASSIPEEPELPDVSDNVEKIFEEGTEECLNGYTLVIIFTAGLVNVVTTKILLPGLISYVRSLAERILSRASSTGTLSR